MAKRKVYIDVIVDDKGTVKRMAVDADKLDKALGKTAKGARTADRNIKGAAQASSNGTKNFSKMAQGISGGLVPAYATLAAQVFAVSAAFNFLKDAGDLRRLEEGQLAYSAAIGVSMQSLTKDMVRATNAQLGFRDAAQAAAIGTAAGLNAEQLTKLAKAADQTSQILGRDLTDSFNRLIRGVTKAEPELLDELGIILRLEDATRRYGQALNISGKLSSFQRTQAVTADVLGQVEAKYAKILEITGEVPNEFAKLSAVFEGLVNDIKQFLGAGFSPLVSLLQQMPQLVIAAFLPFSVSILKAALPGLEDMSGTLRKVATDADVGFKGAQKAQKAYVTQVDKLRGDAALKGKLEKEIKADGAAVAKMNKVRGNSLLARMQRGDILSNAQIKRVERNLKREEGSYKIKDKKVLASYQAMLTKMKAYNDAAQGAIESRVQRTAAAIGMKYKAAEVTVKGAFAGMAQAAATFAGYAATALSVVSWVVLIATIGSLIWSFMQSRKEIEKSQEKYDVLLEKLRDIRNETEKYIAVQNELYALQSSSNLALEAYGKNLGQVNSALFTESLGKSYFKETLADLKGIREEAKASLPDLKAARDADRDKRDPSANYNTRVRLAEAAANSQKAYEKAFRKSRLTLKDYIAENDNLTERQKLSIERVLAEKEMIDEHKNARFQNNEVVKAYGETLDKLIRGEEVNIETLKEQRNAVITLSSSISALNQLAKENKDAFRGIEQKIVPITETDQLIQNLREEISLREAIESTNESVLKQEEEKIKKLQEQVTFLRNISEIEFRSAQARLAIDTASFKTSAGKTKLIREEVNQIAEIAKKEVNIFETEQKIAQGRHLISKEQDRINLAMKEATGEALNQLVADQQVLDSRKKSIIQSENQLSLLIAQKEELINQRNEIEQLKRAAAQAFETNLQSGLAALIKGTESSLKDALLNLAKGVLNSIADMLAEQMTKRIMLALFKEKPPEEKMKEAIMTSSTFGANQISVKMVEAAEQSGAIIANRITTALGGTATTPSASTTGPGMLAKLGPLSTGEDPLGLGNVEILPKGPGMLARPPTQVSGVTKVDKPFSEAETRLHLPGGPVKKTGGLGGLFEGFTGKLKEIFSPEGGFLSKLGGIFKQGLSGFGDLFGKLFSGAGGGGGGFFSGLLGMFGLPFGRYGGVMKPYATGGIARGRNAGYPAILHGTEAVVPLPSGGKIPVEMGKGAAGDTNNVSISVSMSGNDSQSDSKSDGNKGQDLGKVLSQAVQEELQRQKRPGGILSPYGAA